VTFLSWPVAALFTCGIALAVCAAYWLGYKHGSAQSSVEPINPPVPPAAPPPAPLPVSSHIPSYRVNELAILLELGVLTLEEFEHEKGKLHAGRSA
jgi:hypothetical protein